MSHENRLSMLRKLAELSLEAHTIALQAVVAEDGHDPSLSQDLAVTVREKSQRMQRLSTQIMAERYTQADAMEHLTSKSQG